MATELVRGKTVDEALKITNQAVADALDGLPPVKMHCSNLAEEAIRAALEDYQRKNGLLEEGENCNSCSRRCDDIHHAHEEDEE
jgi:nitrogen fixation NifU-like protein